MGAAGFVTVYEREAVERAYERLWPGHSITDDWWYLDTITVELGGVRYIFDYWDDQGGHEGTGNSFWFAIDESDKTDGILRRSILWGGELSAAQSRCKAALYEAKQTGEVEVWT